VNSGNRPETVLVATGVIQKGAAGGAISSQGLFKPTTIIAKQVSAGAVADASALVGKVAAANIYPGQQLTLADFTPGVGIASGLSANERAVSVPVGAAPGLSGNLAAGDHVDIYVGLTSDASGRQTPELRVLASNILVLQAPTSSSGGIASASGGGGNVTLAVTDSLAPTVMFASSNGTLWLALRPGNAANPNPRQIVTLQTLLLGNAPVGTAGR
jgi:Flp pilus assembly protein CpaB